MHCLGMFAILYNIDALYKGLGVIVMIIDMNLLACLIFTSHQVSVERTRSHSDDIDLSLQNDIQVV